ncbi:RHS repeat protein, partial [Escherichia coli]|uniref:RHS repeat protein n=1 Tax=Escherichia coli TaxID=562 RepID=UPI00197E685D
DSDGRVTEQLNPAGLSYTYQYEKDHITITDSLDRREVLHTQGHETRYEYNIAGDLTAVIAPDGSRNGTQYDAWGKAICTT